MTGAYFVLSKKDEFNFMKCAFCIVLFFKICDLAVIKAIIANNLKII